MKSQGFDTLCCECALDVLVCCVTALDVLVCSCISCPSTGVSHWRRAVVLSTNCCCWCVSLLAIQRIVDVIAFFAWCMSRPS